MFEKSGWFFVRQVGSHMMMKKAGTIVTLTVPSHTTLKVGTLRGLIRSAGLTIPHFLALLK